MQKGRLLHGYPYGLIFGEPFNIAHQGWKPYGRNRPFLPGSVYDSPARACEGMP